MATDVFDKMRGLTIEAETVYIVAPGILGKEYIRHIPVGATKIAVNYGIAAIDRFGVYNPTWKTYWMVADSQAPEAFWWSLIDQKVKDWALKIYSRKLMVHPDSYPIDKQPLHYFDEGDALSARDCWPQGGHHRGKLRPNATVVGQALQAVYWCATYRRAQLPKAVLVGVDMMGGRCFDGSQPYDRRENEAWPHLPLLQKLCDVLIAAGMEITTLSPSALKLRRERI